MNDVLCSYVGERWTTPSGDGTTVLDAATGEPVARVSSRGVDMRGAVEHARSVGGPALRRLSFPERAAMLKSLATHLDGRKDAYHELSLHTGATRRDGTVDVDGGIATLFAFSGIGKRELPDGSVLLDGDRITMGRSGAFVAQHVYTPIPGVAVQVNAFNFPVWGMLEKLAPAVLAGVPSIVKPATQTAYLTAAVVRDIVESGILPAGVLQLICGSVADLFDHLDGRDLVAFTGSAGTAGTIRAHAAITARATRFTAETDSLNACILGPDAVPESEEFALFTKEVVREMTVKAGQKCTAIRRALVPAPLVDDVVSALRSRLERVVVGNPRSEAVTMGALASLQQREEVRGAVQQLQRAGDLVSGDPMRVDVVGADAEGGAFMAPLLLLCKDTWRVEPHEVEAFGPVSTVIPYADADEAVSLAVRGKGSLVASVVSHQPEFVRDVVTGIAAEHGRLLVLDRDSAVESTGHGTPMPQTVHGGPGRAGGGEELGGVRAVKHFMQRTAIQGSPAAIDAILGA